MADLDFQKNMQLLMAELPPPIRSFLTNKLADAVRGIVARQKLHIDQGGILERDLILVLLGVRSPDELAANLKTEAALDDLTLKNVLADANSFIFLPINEAMRAAPKIPQSAISAPPIPVKPVIFQSPPPQMPPLPRPMPPPPANLQGTSLAEALAKAGAPASAPRPAPPPAPAPSRVNLLADHEEPHIDFPENMPIFHHTPGEPHLTPPLPPVMPAPAARMPAPPPRPAPAPSAPKKYESDPYKEPIE